MVISNGTTFLAYWNEGANKVCYVIKRNIKKLAYYLWCAYGFIGPRLRLNTRELVTVLVTYYNPARLRHVNHLTRNLLKCEFVGKVVISSHNPDVKLEEHVTIRDPRVILINQSVRRACGYRWDVARQFSPEYLIVIDDDIVLFPWQLKVLFAKLLSEPNLPHGLSGMIHTEDGTLEFRQRENIEVHFLTEIYAVTKDHIEQYFDMIKIFGEQDPALPAEIEYLGDFVVISQTGPLHPRIHRAGRIFRDDTYNVQGTANHKEEQFLTIVNKVARAIKTVRPQLFVSSR